MFLNFIATLALVLFFTSAATVIHKNLTSMYSYSIPPLIKWTGLFGALWLAFG